MFQTPLIAGAGNQFQIRNLRAIEMEALADKWLNSVADRVNALGEQLRQVEAELARRDVKDLSTASSISWLAVCAARSNRLPAQCSHQPGRRDPAMIPRPGPDWHG